MLCSLQVNLPKFKLTTSFGVKDVHIWLICWQMVCSWKGRESSPGESCMLRLGDRRLCKLQWLHCFPRDQYLVLLIHFVRFFLRVFVCQLTSYSLLASQMPLKQWFESFLKLLLSLERSHLSSLLIFPALQWVRETLNCPFSSAEYNIALLWAWVMVCYEWRNCPNKACNPWISPSHTHHTQQHLL